MKKLVELQLNQVNMPLCQFLLWYKQGELLLDPPYQRGDVWGNKRRLNLLVSLFSRIPVPSIVINNRLDAGWGDKKGQYFFAVIDGRQRMSTYLMMLDDQLPMPAIWFGMQPVREDGTLLFSDMPEGHQRRIQNIGIPITMGHLSSVEDEQRIFEMVNYGGIAQGEIDDDVTELRSRPTWLRSRPT